MSIEVLLAIFAAVLAVLALFMSRAQDLVAWAVLLLAIGVIVSGTNILR
jgi:hypothetical protein